MRSQTIWKVTWHCHWQRCCDRWWVWPPPEDLIYFFFKKEKKSIPTLFRRSFNYIYARKKKQFIFLSTLLSPPTKPLKFVVDVSLRLVQLTFLSGLAISGRTAQNGLTNSRNLTGRDKTLIYKQNWHIQLSHSQFTHWSFDIYCVNQQTVAQACRTWPRKQYSSYTGKARRTIYTNIQHSEWTYVIVATILTSHLKRQISNTPRKCLYRQVCLAEYNDHPLYTSPV